MAGLLARSCRRASKNCLSLCYSPDRRPAFGLLGLLITFLIAAAGCDRRHDEWLHGYVEGEYVRVASPVGGTLLRCTVERGGEVQVGDPLFVLESVAEQAAVTEAEKRARLAAARLENLRKGRRPSEIAALEARLDQARASLSLWNAEFGRREKLRQERVISDAELDQTRSQRDSAEAGLAATQADLTTARLGGRDDEIRAAEAEFQAAQAAQERAKWALDQKSQSATCTGLVHDTMFRPGEFVPAGQPVVSLLPPGNIKIRFFAPETRLAQIPPGTKIKVRIDGLDSAIEATVSYRATQPEYTPPVIYSRESRSRLVYLVEARPEPNLASRLHPGQPVDVQFAAPAP